MPIDPEIVERLSRLARPGFGDADRRTLTEQLQRMVAFMERLNGLEVQDAAPTSQVLDVPQAFRDDTPVPSAQADLVLENTPEAGNGQLRFPKFSH